MFNISRMQAEGLVGADAIASAQEAGCSSSNELASSIVSIASNPVALASEASSLRESVSRFPLDKAADVIVEEICRHLPNLPDYVALRGVLRPAGRAEVLRSFSRLTAAEKKRQWLAFVVGGDVEMTAFFIASGVSCDLLNATDANGDTALARAAGSGNVEIVRLLLSCPGIAPNACVPLTRAAWMGHRDCVQALLQRTDINVNVINEQGDTALELAAGIGNADIVQLLLRHRDVDPNLGVALLRAAAGGHFDIVRSLLQTSRVNVNASDRYGRTALGMAASIGNREIVKILLSHPEIAPNLGLGLLHAASKGHKGIVFLLLKRPDINVNATDGKANSALGMAVASGNAAIVQMLLSRNDINPNLGAPLLQAALRARMGLFCVLLNVPCIDINASDHTGNSALGVAAGIGNMRMVAMLLKHPDIAPHIGTPLVQAVAAGHLSIFHTLLRTPGIDVNAIDGHANTALGAAAGIGNADIVRRLLNCSNIRPNLGVPLLRAVLKEDLVIVRLLLQAPGINVNAVDAYGRTALGIAARVGNVNILKMLLNRPYINPNHGIALLHAASKGHREIAERLLVAPGINVNVTDRQGNTALGFAARSGSTGIVRILLNRMDVDVNLGIALLQAAAKGHEEIVRDLLEVPGCNVNLVDRVGISALGIAAGIGNLGMVEMLLSRVDINVNLGAPLKHAASNGHLPVIYRLMQVSAINVNTVDSSGWPALAAAAINGHADIVKLLLRDPAIDPNLGMPLSEAAAHGYLEIVTALLRDDRIEVNAANEDGGTALSLAAEYGYLSIVTRLLRHPDINPDLGTPLVSAADKGHLELVQALLRVPGINVNRRNPIGNAALTVAAYGSCTEIVDVLLKVDSIDVNIVDGTGYTALQWAASLGNVDMVDMLLNCADINFVGGAHFSALTMAAINGHVDVVRMMLAHPDIDPNRDAVLVEVLTEGRLEIFYMLMDVAEIDVNRVDEMGLSALGWAACNGERKIAKRLLCHPEINPNRGAPLALAASHGELGLVCALLDVGGIDVNHKGEHAATALLHACYRGHVEIVATLLKVPGIDVGSTNEFGQSALDLTSVEYRSAVERLLSERHN